MSKLFVLLLMVFCHVIDDFFLQGVLADMKRKDWKSKDEQTETEQTSAMCRYDYIAALVAHSTSWAFMIMLPIAIFFDFAPPPAFYIAFVINLTIHAVVDNMKANRKTINLITDQLIHMVQIGITALVFLVLM